LNPLNVKRDVLSLEGVRRNLNFIILEVRKQLESAQTYIETPSIKLHEKVSQREDYVDNLKSLIENECYHRIFKSEGIDYLTVNLLRAIITTAGNLERIGDFMVNIVRQADHFSNRSLMVRYGYTQFFQIPAAAMKNISIAVFDRDMDLALEICQSEAKLDTLYKDVLDKILEEMNQGLNPPDLMTAHKIFHYLERTGDAIQNIGEAVIFAVLGEKLKVSQYFALKESVSSGNGGHSLKTDRFESVWETRSGCRIGRIRENGHEGASSWAIFKEGALKKIKGEKDGIEKWHNTIPGIAPKLYDFQRIKNKGTILVEHISGHTLQEMVLGSSYSQLRHLLKRLFQTLEKIWDLTKEEVTVNAGFLKQAKNRLGDVFTVYPEFNYPEQKIGNIINESFSHLLEHSSKLEAEIKAPFKVLIHGDFNIDNIMYHPLGDSIHFIDLHRSETGDYVQDVSVFLVSNFRLPVFENEQRSKLNDIMETFYRFARSYAVKNGDRTFEKRLALGLARSFLTSTRFAVSPDFARTLFLRSTYILEKFIEAEGSEDFIIPSDIFYY